MVTASLVAFCAAAQAQSTMSPEVEVASYIVLCEGYAKENAPQDLPFWQEAKTEVELPDLQRAQRALGAVEKSLSQIDPALIARRCADFKEVWEDPEGSDYEEPSPEAQALSAKVQTKMSKLLDQMLAANFAPDNANIVLKYMVTISNASADRMQATEHMDKALTMMRNSLTMQKRALSSSQVKDSVSAQESGGFYVCAASATLSAAQAFDAGQYDFADRFMAERMLWSALINRDRAPGEDILSSEAMAKRVPHSIDLALTKLDKDGRLGPEDQRVVNMAEDMCLKTVPAALRDPLITSPIFAAVSAAN